MFRSISKQSVESVESLLKERKEGYGGKYLCITLTSGSHLRVDTVFQLVVMPFLIIAVWIGMIEPGIMLVLIPVLHYYIGAIITVMLSEVI